MGRGAQAAPRPACLHGALCTPANSTSLVCSLSLFHSFRNNRLLRTNHCRVTSPKHTPSPPAVAPSECQEKPEKVRGEHRLPRLLPQLPTRALRDPDEVSVPEGAAREPRQGARSASRARSSCRSQHGGRAGCAARSGRVTGRRPLPEEPGGRRGLRQGAERAGEPQPPPACVHVAQRGPRWPSRRSRDAGAESPLPVTSCSSAGISVLPS